MHTCVRCGKQAGSIEEIHNGCPCGSKVFVFNKDAVQEQQAQPSQKPAAPEPQALPSQASSSLMQQAITWEKTPQMPAQAQSGEEDGNANTGAGDGSAGGKAPESYFARATFSTEDVENIKIVTEGVFCVDINALSKNPVVLKDEEGVYYVKIPFGQDKWDGEKTGDSSGKVAAGGKK